MLFFSFLTDAQVADNFLYEKSIPGNYTDFEVDALGNIYLLAPNNQLKKINRLYYLIRI
jgi:hypothetical protein